MKKTKKLMLAGMAAVPILSFGSIAAAASSDTNPQDSLVEKIATKFNLNKDEVKAVFDEEHFARRAEHEQEFADQLADAVSEGELSQEQADKITAKRKELNEQRETNKSEFDSLTDEERKSRMDEERAALDSWLEENDIDRHWLMMGGHRGFNGPGGPGMFGQREHSDNSAEQ